MIPGNRCPRFFQTASEYLKMTASIVYWAIMVGGVLLLPVLFVIAYPFLISSQSILLSQVSESPPQKESTLFIAAHMWNTVLNEFGLSSSQPHQPFSHRRHRPEHAKKREEIHLLVDTSRHRLFVKEGNRILHMATVSTGSGEILKDPRNPERVWTFETPKGTFSIQSKIDNPVWIRPDWAFIEQGNPIPEKMTDRLKPGVLGQYALGFGDGYFIHGALYSNLLGQAVTHGCIQVGRKDLEYVYGTVPLGAPLIIL